MRTADELLSFETACSLYVVVFPVAKLVLNLHKLVLKLTEFALSDEFLLRHRSKQLYYENQPMGSCSDLVSFLCLWLYFIWKYCKIALLSVIELRWCHIKGCAGQFLSSVLEGSQERAVEHTKV